MKETGAFVVPAHRVVEAVEPLGDVHHDRRREAAVVTEGLEIDVVICSRRAERLEQHSSVAASGRRRFMARRTVMAAIRRSRGNSGHAGDCYPLYLSANTLGLSSYMRAYKCYQCYTVTLLRKALRR